LRRPFIAADLEALTVGEMIGALRSGLRRRPGIFPMPPALIGFVLRSVGREEIYRRMSGSLVADPSALINLGWTPVVMTNDGLGKLMQASKNQQFESDH
jgi:UDP-glucose 4-epimerase